MAEPLLDSCLGTVEAAVSVIDDPADASEMRIGPQELLSLNCGPVKACPGNQVPEGVGNGPGEVVDRRLIPNGAVREILSGNRVEEIGADDPVVAVIADILQLGQPVPRQLPLSAK